MANSFAVSRSHLIYGLCLPLAVLVGYLLASPLDSSSVAVVALVLSVLSMPLLMRWHHPLLLLSWNAAVAPAFLPGSPYLWMIMAIISCFFCVLNRSLGQKVDFFVVPSVSRSLLFFGAVVCITAVVTGGVGIRSLGSETFGGKKYIYLISAIVGYFALACQKIPKERAKFWIVLFFLSGLTWLVGFLGTASGHFSFLQNLFVSDGGMDDSINPSIFVEQIRRPGDVGGAALALFCALMAYYGVRGLFNIRKPWRLAFLGMALCAILLAGFRSMLLLLALTFLVLFYLEGLFRTRYFLILLLGGTLLCAAVIPVVHRLPLSVQRTLSFLPINVDPFVRRDAEASTAWRLDLWKELVPQIPKYLIKGKGYGLSPDELFMAWESNTRGYAGSTEISLVAGDYHSGPLSLIIPFGIFGVIGFVWFLGASLKFLYQTYRYGDPALRQINTFLLAYFVVRIFHYFFIFGSVHSDLCVFTGLVGLSVSLNRGTTQPVEDLAVAEAVVA